jgi:hypothetical protein
MKARNKKAVGTSNDLEKRYLRLTSAPEGGKVRPPAVLKEALALVKEVGSIITCSPVKCSLMGLNIRFWSAHLQVYE